VIAKSIAPDSLTRYKEYHAVASVTLLKIIFPDDGVHLASMGIKKS